MQSKWTPYSYSPVIFSPMFESLSYGNPSAPGNTPQVLQANLDMLESTDPEGITVDLGYAPWLDGDRSRIREDTHFINEIRSSHKLLVLKDASSETYRSHPLPWPEFEAAWIQRVRTLAALYHPDYYTVIKEPGWYVPMIAGLSHDLQSPADVQVLNAKTWLALLAKLIAAVHAVSPATRVGISIPGDSLYGVNGALARQFFSGASHLAGLSFLGFDIYDTAAFADTQRFLGQFGTGGKQVWINEAWSTTTIGEARDPARARLDQQWMRALYQFGLYIHAQGISPFYTDILASYGPRPTTSASLIAYYGRRTPVFHTLVNVISENRAGKK